MRPCFLSQQNLHSQCTYCAAFFHKNTTDQFIGQVCAPPCGKPSVGEARGKEAEGGGGRGGPGLLQPLHEEVGVLRGLGVRQRGPRNARRMDGPPGAHAR